MLVVVHSRFTKTNFQKTCDVKIDHQILVFCLHSPSQVYTKDLGVLDFYRTVQFPTPLSGWDILYTVASTENRLKLARVRFVYMQCRRQLFQFWYFPFFLIVIQMKRIVKGLLTFFRSARFDSRIFSTVKKLRIKFVCTKLHCHFHVPIMRKSLPTTLIVFSFFCLLKRCS